MLVAAVPGVRRTWLAVAPCEPDRTVGENHLRMLLPFVAQVLRGAQEVEHAALELAERYWRRGHDKKALESLQRLQSRFPSDAGVLSAIADMYQRWGKEELAIAEYERLAKLEPDDPGHLITLGEQYWQKGDKPRAIATWKKIAQSGKANGFA